MQYNQCLHGLSMADVDSAQVDYGAEVYIVPSRPTSAALSRGSTSSGRPKPKKIGGFDRLRIQSVPETPPEDPKSHAFVCLRDISIHYTHTQSTHIKYAYTPNAVNTYTTHMQLHTDANIYTHTLAHTCTYTHNIHSYTSGTGDGVQRVINRL
jgi:hypothetical protein